MIARILRYFEVVMVLGYVGFGIFVLFFSAKVFTLIPIQRIVLGVVLISYGIFRSYKAYKKNFKNEDDDL
jgi:hypothetical protein